MDDLGFVITVKFTVRFNVKLWLRFRSKVSRRTKVSENRSGCAPFLLETALSDFSTKQYVAS